MNSVTLASTEQYLSFILEDELFALDISSVREVLDYKSITKIPRMPNFILGVINLRGNVVSVVDMRMKLGMKKAKRTVHTCIVIIEVNIEEEIILMGILVDSVREVFELPGEDIEMPPKFGSGMNMEFIKGMGKKDDSFIMVLDINRIFSSEEIVALKQNNKNCAI